MSEPFALPTDIERPVRVLVNDILTDPETDSSRISNRAVTLIHLILDSSEISDEDRPDALSSMADRLAKAHQQRMQII